jgi:Tfp pilus assembly protein PilF
MRSQCLRTVLLIVVSMSSWGKPYTPSNDAVVLEQVPAAAETRRLETFRRALQADPNDMQSALQLAQGYLEIGRASADPRFISYAQATLTPWLQHPVVPAPILVLSATALQSSHQFDAALEQLDRALTIAPQDARAWLLKATILQVQGKLPQARTACTQLVRTAGQMVALTCMTSVNSLNGRLDASYAALLNLRGASEQLPATLNNWLEGQLGEMAARRQDFAAAQTHYLAALKAVPDDLYVKAVYADLLLDAKRDREVIALLKDNEQQDVLLLRLAIAGHRLGSADGRRWTELFAARVAAARRDQDFTHLREQARFQLEVRGQVQNALQLAERNWEVQREPADIRIFLQAAQAAHQPERASQVLAWINSMHYEDRTVDSLRSALTASAYP